MTGLPGETVDRLQVLLCDADGNLFPSEEPAFVASAEVTNSFLAQLGVPRRYAPEELRLATTGMNFRSTAQALAAEYGVGEVSDLEDWVQEEKRVVTSHLSSTLVPDGQVLAPLGALEEHLLLAAVSSSALARLAGCFTPTSKPDPAIYRHSCAQLGIAPDAGLAVEDSVPGARSAIAAGCPTVGNLVFVPPAERAQRADALREAGVAAVVSSWAELADLLLPALRRRASAAGPNPTGASR
jgi:HAD superfamily hydrolase (TIGR01509 family)